jgi:hypothetical protein
MIDIEGSLFYFSISLLGGICIGARTLLVKQLIWFDYVARLSQWGGGGYCTCSNDDYLPRGRGGGVSSTQYPVGMA